MGPLLTQGVIGAEWHFVIAFVIGLFFGFILEQAGFSSSRKLAGVFYGYDFTVLRVFFTAAITAAIGLIFFSYFGWIDLDLIWVNPLYVWPTIVGGIIMGLGFIIGGFCPGTSISAASIGKIDAMFFLGGIILGIFLYVFIYPLIMDFRNLNPQGSVMVYDALGMSRSVFMVVLVVVALAAFWVTHAIQQKVSDPDAKY